MLSDYIVAPAKPKNKRRLYATCSILGIGVVALIGYSVAPWRHSDLHIAIPQSVASQALFPIYIPSTLPSGYNIQPGSFALQNYVLTFSAANAHGQTIAITEQARPQGFDFTNFNQQQLQSARSLSNTPYPSIVGTFQKSTLLSIVTTDTWMIVTASQGSQVSADDMYHVALGIKPQK